MSLLAIDNLSIALPKGADRELAVKDVSFTLDKGEVLCIVGESGSGKSMSANALMGLLPEGVTPSAGSIHFENRDLLTLSDDEMMSLRGKDISMIFQEPLSALNPLMRVGDQIAEVFEAHDLLTPTERRKRALELLHEVGLPDPDTTIRAYPFQLSGGQRQRVVIAMALALEPKILIADEPTTALDVTTQAQILDLIEDLRMRHGMAVLFITHDFGVVADIADRVIVMQHGEVVEAGEAETVLLNPTHAYTRALLDAIPGLSFRETMQPANTPILSVRDLSMTFTSRTGGFFRKPRVVKAVQDASFDLYKGETIGIVGESGSGKSTLGRCLVRLLNPEKGVVEIGGKDISKINGSALRQHRRRIQMVFQDPYSSLNPRSRIGTILTEGLIAYGTDKITAREKAQELLTLVGLDPSAMKRFPHEFSGGQRQRVGIARALALEPEVVIADEAVSALDVSIQAQVLDLLADLRDRLNLSMIFITHDLRVAAQVCDRIIVMQQGKMVEFGPSSQVLGSPQTEYTKSLLDAIPGKAHEQALAAQRELRQ
ncbi:MULTISPECIES: ABC transporter ATP-binding protein [Marivita]|uniref:ABC transporter ATP-binding protein n=1 Tax=Marivita cryptomonadis TaxID=505252 RepID=A0A9Q2S456_9RHOB|nr:MULTISPECIES: ABC transporter ATP-binding protein [Marivita]MCR9169257.1 ABC transporter ATP-binding protein [Paracoccaceae bacterium]MBM2324010.1 ABC transporter ATP-binding protein [Marivita cryptomonadis]MBM2333599.1 ABC transporter ATP-binding protein [Marivita cryptomonadis]MBM2343177.1 ABC transporter ATP-binding protein [Marivita cryptomonadis]MBM2347848.1 ABC transporter ATP-binding protein [Marivita cryptomonadis]